MAALYEAEVKCEPAEETSSKRDSMILRETQRRSPEIVDTALKPAKSIRGTFLDHDASPTTPMTPLIPERTATDSEMVKEKRHDGHFVQLPIPLESPGSVQSTDERLFDNLTNSNPPHQPQGQLESTSVSPRAGENTVGSPKSGKLNRRSWRGGISGFWRPPSFLSNDPNTSSPNIVPSLAELPATPLGRLAREASNNREGNSFFDAMSTDEEEISSPETAQTGTRTLERPRLVEARSSSSSGLRQFVNERSHHLSPPTEPGPSRAKAAKLLGLEGKLKEVGALTPFTDIKDNPLEHTRPIQFSWGHGTYGRSLRTSRDDKLVEASHVALPPTPGIKHALPDSLPSTAVTSSTSLSVDQTNQDHPIKSPIPPSPHLSFPPSSIIEIPPTPLRIAGLETLPSPLGGLGRLSGVPYARSRHGVMDGLRSNPPETNASLQHTISAPPLPFRRSDANGNSLLSDSPARSLGRSKNRNRRVTIRPLDLKAIDVAHANGMKDNSMLEVGTGQHGPTRGWVRENIVSTPHPSRAASLASMGKSEATSLFPRKSEIPDDIREAGRVNLEEVGEENSPTTLASASTASAKMGAVRSEAGSCAVQIVSTDETLVLALSVAGHPYKKKNVVISIRDRGTFDDHQLFCQIRSEYRALIGTFRLFLSARRLVGITIRSKDDQGTDTSIFYAAFLQSFETPTAGRRRKTWLNFLRSQQPQSREAEVEAVPDPKPLVTTSQTTEPWLRSSDAPPTLVSTCQTPKTLEPEDLELPEQRSLARAVPLSSLKWAPKPRVLSNDSHQDKDVLVITFHHAFSLAAIATATLALLLLAGLTCVLYIVLGKPGHGDGDDREYHNGDWRQDAGERVLTGWVLGLGVLIGGGLLEGLWCWGNWLVL